MENFPSPFKMNLCPIDMINSLETFHAIFARTLSRCWGVSRAPCELLDIILLCLYRARNCCRSQLLCGSHILFVSCEVVPDSDGKFFIYCKFYRRYAAKGFISTQRSHSCLFLRAQSTWRLERKNRKQWSCLPLPLPFWSIQCSRQRASGSWMHSLGVGVAGENLSTDKNVGFKREPLSLINPSSLVLLWQSHSDSFSLS